MSSVSKKIEYTYDSVNKIREALESKGFNMNNVPLMAFADLIKQLKKDIGDIPTQSEYSPYFLKLEGNISNTIIHGTYNIPIICSIIQMNGYIQGNNTIIHGTYNIPIICSIIQMNGYIQGNNTIIHGTYTEIQV